MLLQSSTSCSKHHFQSCICRTPGRLHKDDLSPKLQLQSVERMKLQCSSFCLPFLQSCMRRARPDIALEVKLYGHIVNQISSARITFGCIRAMLRQSPTCFSLHFPKLICKAPGKLDKDDLNRKLQLQCIEGMKLPSPSFCVCPFCRAASAEPQCEPG